VQFRTTHPVQPDGLALHLATPTSLDKPQHYQYQYKGIKLDPYRICEVYNVGGGAREQIIKKGLRWTNKGDSERQVLKEIMQACERRLEMLDEDAL